MRSSRRGLALLVVIGVLGVLVVLGVSFVTMARLERRASQQRLVATQALLLARSGVEDALARLSAGQDVSLSPSAYGGENWDGSSDGLLSGWEAQQEVYRATGTGTPADVETCPVQHALRPSFFVGAGGNPVTLAVDGRQRGVSGLLAPSAGGRNAYSLKVEDESAKINVNGGFLDAGDRDGDGTPDHRDPDVAAPATPVLPMGADGIGRGFNRQLVRILNVLGAQGEVAVPSLGDLLIQARPRGGYRSVAQAQAVLGTAKDLSPWLTVSSWADAKVVHPNGYPAEPIPVYALSEVKKARLPLRLEEGGRPPVNLNAASRPVLVALLQGLRAEACLPEMPVNPAIPAAWNAYEISPALAAQVADAVLTFRAGREPFAGWTADPNRPTPGPFDAWGTFSAFCDGLVPTVVSNMLLSPSVWGGGDLAGAALLKANFDPNTDLNKQLPDELMFRWVDKSDLNVWSTEGSLGPTGVFQVACAGRILGGDGRLLAERTVAGRVEVFSLLRQTTQKDFVGDRRPLGDYLSLSTDPLCRTTGASAGAGWWGGIPPGSGAAVMTYPCSPLSLPGTAADFDGSLALATVETSPLPPAGVVPASPFFLHHFDDGWDGDLGVTGRVTPGPSEPGLPVSDQCLQGDPTVGVWPDSTQPAPFNEPGTLYPDGVHSQCRRCPAYSTANFPPSWVSGDPAPSNHGVISYWVKPCPGKMVSLHIQSTRYTAVETQTLMTGQKESVMGIIVESRADGDGAAFAFERQERQNWDGGSTRMPGLRWHLLTCRFDTDEGVPEDLGCDDRALGALPPDMVPDTPPAYTTPYAISLGEDLFAGVQAFIVGVVGGQAANKPFGVNQVVDELAVCDFGDQGSSSASKSSAWAALRYQDGRYYKGSDGAFLSAPLAPGGRLLSAQWTAYLPRENRQEVLAPAQTPVPRKIDATLGSMRLEVDLLDEAGLLLGPALEGLTQGGRVGHPLGRFRYRVRFKVKGITPNDPVLETPWFDDITFAWQRASGPRVLGWGAP